MGSLGSKLQRVVAPIDVSNAEPVRPRFRKHAADKPNVTRIVFDKQNFVLRSFHAAL